MAKAVVESVRVALFADAVGTSKDGHSAADHDQVLYGEPSTEG